MLLKHNNKWPEPWLVLLIFGALAAVYLLLPLIDQGDIGISYDWNVPQSAVSFVQSPLFSAWSNGQPAPPANTWYGWAIYKILFLFGLSSSAITYVFLVSTLMFSGFFLFLLGRQIKLRTTIAFLAGVIYMSSQQLLILTHHGYFFEMMAFAMTPLLMFIFLKYFNRPTLSLALLGALVFSVASTQPQFFVVNAMLLAGLSFLFPQQWRHTIKFFLVTLFINLLLSSSWLVMYYRYINVASYSQQILQAGYRGFQYNGIIDLLYVFFTTSAVRDYLSSLGQSWLQYFWQFSQALVFAVPLLLFSAARSSTNKKFVRPAAAFLGILLIGFTLTKGRADPFSWTGDLFYQLPLLSSLFRDINHFYFLITFSAVMLFAVTVECIWSICKPRTLKWLLPGLVTFTLVYVSPYLMNVYRSVLHQYQLDWKSYDSLLSRYNSQDSENARIMWVPLGGWVMRSGEKMRYSGVNPLVRAVSALPINERNAQSGEPSAEAQLVYFQSCSRIPGCAERLLGLKSVQDVIVLTRDLGAATPFIRQKEYYRNWRFWHNNVPLEWMKGLYLGSVQIATDAYTIYRLDSAVTTPVISVPKHLVFLSGTSPDLLLDGVALNDVAESSYVSDKKLRSNAHQEIIPINFSEWSPTAVRRSGSQIVTTVDIPEDGEYQTVFYQKSGTASSPLTVFRVKGVDHEQRLITMEKFDSVPKQLQGRNPAISDSVSLRRGSYQLALSNSVDVNNMILDPSFDLGPWPDRAFDCPLTGGATAVVKSDAQQKNYVELSNRKVGACQMTAVGGILPNQKYLLSFDVQHISGSMPSVCIKVDDDDYCRGRVQLSDTDTGWQHVEMVYEQGDSTQAVIRLMIPAGKGISVNRFDNVELRRVAVPETIAFVKKRTPTASYKTEGVEVRQESNTRFRVLIRQGQGTVPIVLTDKYHPAWRAYIKREAEHLNGFSDVESLTESQAGWTRNIRSVYRDITETTSLNPITSHFVANGDANLWMVELSEQPKDVELIVEFAPQRVYTLGIILAGVTAGAIVLYSLINVVIVSRRRKESQPVP